MPVALVGECSIPVVESRSPATVLVAGGLEVETLAVHSHGDVADAQPREFEPGAKRLQRAIVQRQGAPGEADSRTEELAPLVEHGLLDHLIGPR